jgi:hypothetical protein
MTKRPGGDQLASFSQIVLGVVLVITCLVFLVAGAVMKGGFERAWDVLLGIQTPFGDAPGLGIPLSALGYLLVPAVIGVAVADGIARFVQSKLDSLPEVEKRIIDRAREAARQETAKRSSHAPEKPK